MSNEDLTIDCVKHGVAITATVCSHLVNNNGAPLGIIENSSEPNDLQCWCYACEYLFLQEADRTDVFRKFCNFSVVCSECYKEIKLAHDINA